MSEAVSTAARSAGHPERDLWENPMGTDGFAFVEFAAPEPEALHKLLKQLGFTAVARHRNRDCILFRQGHVNVAVTAAKEGHAGRFAEAHGPSACAMGFRVSEPDYVHAKLLELDATPAGEEHGSPTFSAPAIEGIGGSLVYLVAAKDEEEFYESEFEFFEGVERHPEGVGLILLDHLTHNVHRGRMDHWAKFYEKLFNFREIRYFDIEGKLTGLKSRAMTGPDGKLRIPINESAGKDGKTDQIEEYLEQYNGEGIQHIALATQDICATVDGLAANGVKFMTPPPETYYEMLDERLPGHGQNVGELKKRAILMDGTPDGKILLQIFTETVIGPIFFEIISRKGDEGFGEGNFKALFESMERDQIRRGVL
ncbi:MAG: 4-hydroxyphenylpyruvate dioxygenase, partial [Alphaproteobacteria bacterium]